MHLNLYSSNVLWWDLVTHPWLEYNMRDAVSFSGITFASTQGLSWVSLIILILLPQQVYCQISLLYSYCFPPSNNQSIGSHAQNHTNILLLTESGPWNLASTKDSCPSQSATVAANGDFPVPTVQSTFINEHSRSKKNSLYLLMITGWTQLFLCYLMGYNPLLSLILIVKLS